MCYLYIVKMISEGWWVLLRAGGSQKDKRPSPSVLVCQGLLLFFKNLGALLFSFFLSDTLLAYWNKFSPHGADQCPSASGVSIVRLQCNHCAFVQAAQAERRQCEGSVPRCGQAVLCDPGGVWPGCNDMLFLPLIGHRCMSREHGDAVVPCARSGLCRGCPTTRGRAGLTARPPTITGTTSASQWVWWNRWVVGQGCAVGFGNRGCEVK